MDIYVIERVANYLSRSLESELRGVAEYLKERYPSINVEFNAEIMNKYDYGDEFGAYVRACIEGNIYLANLLELSEYYKLGYRVACKNNRVALMRSMISKYPSLLDYREGFCRACEACELSTIKTLKPFNLLENNFELNYLIEKDRFDVIDWLLTIYYSDDRLWDILNVMISVGKGEFMNYIPSDFANRPLNVLFNVGAMRDNRELMDFILSAKRPALDESVIRVLERTKNVNEMEYLRKKGFRL